MPNTLPRKILWAAALIAVVPSAVRAEPTESEVAAPTEDAAQPLQEERGGEETGRTEDRAQRSAEKERPHTVDTRPVSLRIEAGIWTSAFGLFGAAVGFGVHSRTALEVGAGLGLAGWRLGVLARYYVPWPSSRAGAWSFGAGPSIALLSEGLGLNVPHRDDITVADSDVFHLFNFDVEAGIEYRGSSGWLFRVAFGAMIRVAENMTPLCKWARTGEEHTPCNPAHFATPQDLASQPIFPYFVGGFGYAF